MNSFGDNFRIAIFGESHAPATGIVLDGVPAGIELSQNDFTADILRRKSGSLGTTPRIEDDIPEILSGVADGCTTGAPLTIIFRLSHKIIPLSERSQDPDMQILWQVLNIISTTI